MNPIVAVAHGNEGVRECVIFLQANSASNVGWERRWWAKGLRRRRRSEGIRGVEADG